LQLAIAQRFCVANFVFSTLSVFKAAYHEYPFAFSVMSVMPWTRSGVQPGILIGGENNNNNQVSIFNGPCFQSIIREMRIFLSHFSELLNK